ncbi:hypothetical protein vBBak6_115 [Bacillus phage v_B-Bak6]|uniref:HNH nuclease domain-containing protein n=2 Tax=Basiliskvirus TaxID=3044670 RepID=A0A385IK21_9CAUD|nr:endonuclease [Bacillus phage Basilisk]YP_010657015.1 endonuclease [Bacillus phage v_B-Bak10]AXY83075.1 hypothetical protein vBBak1_115 [Bacillus phage v_B-Bak1]AXY83195.1 hypothetical protein vBBak6_115 [Bacillus phage v_B-Bak6]AGR46660.1 hypothetical protein BASILISK_126 [Bacillus phage Basilisk]AXY83245.1 hypothetical protein vBBBak10_108 [Bacillus phage v_B-Bak10]
MPYIEEKVKLHGNAKRIEYEINDDGCWNCISHVETKFGHNQITRKGFPLMHVHNYVYRITKGDIPKNNVVRHKCDNPNCINPNHLEIGTQKDNMKDAEIRGRAKIRSGSGNIKAELTEKQVKEIRKLLNEGIMQKDIVNMYGISKSTVSKIKNNILWKNVI